jgi:hypothetical protein
MSLKTLAITVVLLLGVALPANAQGVNITLGPPPGRPAGNRRHDRIAGLFP